jgi:3-methyladenine DNA glycosylase/8-oxoguanine DNA glycosylase
VLATPKFFHFHHTITSHGWYQLAPFTYDASQGFLTRVHQLSDGVAVRVQMSASVDGLQVVSDISLTPVQTNELHEAVARMLCFDWDIDALYSALEAYPPYAWVAQEWHGRLLVAPTIWEDMAKVLLTTNTTWSQTIAMVKRVCALGQACSADFAFPTPQQIARLSLSEFAEVAKIGYRAESLYGLAQAICGGLDVESWRSLSSEALYKNIRAQKGFGDYATSTLLRHLGHFDRIAIDSVCRATYKRVTQRSEAPDKDIREHYAQFANWQGMVMWLDVIR